MPDQVRHDGVRRRKYQLIHENKPTWRDLAEDLGFESLPLTSSAKGTTSLFPDSRTGGYVLPLKADIRRRAGIAADDEVTVRLKLAACS